MRPWRDVISVKTWQAICSETFSPKKATGWRVGYSAQQRDVLAITQALGTYHAIPKDRLDLIPQRIQGLNAISRAAGDYLRANRIDEVVAAKRISVMSAVHEVLPGGGVKTTHFDRNVRDAGSGRFEFQDPRKESLERNILTLKRRSLRKAAYLRSLEVFYADAANKKTTKEMIAVLLGKHVSDGMLTNLVPGVWMEAHDPYHRPIEIEMLEDGTFERRTRDGTQMNTAFADWIEKPEYHHLPFFMYLETTVVCLAEKKNGISENTASVSYAHADQGRNDGRWTKLRLVIVDGGVLKMATVGSGEDPVVADTADYVSASGKGGPAFAAYVWSAQGDLFIGEHKEAAFHHSTFVSGAAVRCAGMIKISNGRVAYVTNNSGHYQPSKKHLRNFVTMLAKEGVLADDALVGGHGIEPGTRAIDLQWVHRNRWVGPLPPLQ